MLIDLAEENLRTNEPIRDLTGTGTKVELDYLAEQVKLLDDKCPRYDVHNIQSVLFPVNIDGESLIAQKRNASAKAKRDALLKIARSAPLGYPWVHFYLECRINEWQRAGFLVRWDAIKRCFVCTVLYDSARVAGMIELIEDAFEVFLGPDDLFGSYTFSRRLGADKAVIEQHAELVRTSIELLNWDRDDVPTVTRTHEKVGKPVGKKKHIPKKSSPTIINFELFLKKNMSGLHRSSQGGHIEPVLHLVRGHYKNYKYEAPRFGRLPVLGSTYGRLWTKPHKSGTHAGGVAKTPRAVIRIGELECA